MCGIVAAISTKNISGFLIEGLSKLEYRGYDSAGLAVIVGGLKRLRNTGRVAQLASQVKEKNVGVLVTDHNVRDTLNIVERAYIIHNGEIMKTGTPKEIAQDRNVKQVYLGSKFKF